MDGRRTSRPNSIIIDNNNNDNKTSHMDRLTLPNEILSKIIYQALFSSNFLWPNHRYYVYNQLCNAG